MVGSCSQPIKANKVISCGTRDSQHPIKTAATERDDAEYDLHSCMSAVHANCEFAPVFMAYGTRDFQHSIRTAATNRWRIMISTHVYRPCGLLANCEFVLHGVRNSRFSTSIRKQQQRDWRLMTRQSPFVSVVRANCLQTANFLFLGVTHSGNQNRQRN